MLLRLGSGVSAGIPLAGAAGRHDYAKLTARAARDTRSAAVQGYRHPQRVLDSYSY
jgi:hypothetical protein